MDEPSMLGLITSGKVHAKTLIWHSALEVWQEAGVLSPNWWQPKIDKPKEAKDSGTTGIGPTRRSPVPIAPSEAPKKVKAAGLLKRLFGGRDKEE